MTTIISKLPNPDDRWGVDPMMKQAHIYRPSQTPEVIDKPESFSGERILPGFVIDVRPVWEVA